MKLLLPLAAALSLAVSASAAMAADIAGSYPVTITGSKDYNGTHCLVLGQGAELDGTYVGGFQVIGRVLSAFLDIDGSGQEPATLLFSAPAKDGNIGKGALFEYIQGGYLYDSGEAKFGKKGGC